MTIFLLLYRSSNTLDSTSSLTGPRHFPLHSVHYLRSAERRREGRRVSDVCVTDLLDIDNYKPFIMVLFHQQTNHMRFI